jgi:hypothetical protein
MPRFSAPRNVLAGLMVVAIVTAGCAAATTTAPPPSAAGGAGQVAATRPVLEMTITGGLGAGTYVSDPASTLNYCLHSADGSWRYMYGGGDPWASVDLLFGARVAERGGAGDVAAEIETGSAYLWIDQPNFRGGDAKGRSSATVAVSTDATAITFHVTGSTPDRTPAGDGMTSTLDLTVTCPA